MVQDIWRHRIFELGIADEEYHWQECVARKIEAVHECADVEIVLMERILESVLLPINLLRPLGLFFRSEDPAPVVFRFDDDDPEWGNNNMIKLGGSLTVGARQVEVVESVVGGGIEAGQALGNRAFAAPSFEASGSEDSDDDQQC